MIRRVLLFLMLATMLVFVPVAAAQQTATQVLTITVTAPPAITFSTTTLPNVVISGAYSQQVSASGGVGALSYSVTAGGLPSGLALTTGGLLSGTANTAGTFNFTVQAADSETPVATKTQNFTVVVIAKLIFTTSTIPTPILNEAYTGVVNFTGGIGPYVCSISSGALPPGLSISTVGTSCVISGTPTAVGSVAVSVQVVSAQ